MKLNATRNPYENAELFCTLERIRRKGDLDTAMDTELGELLMSTARYAITCYLRSGKVMKDAPSDIESDILMYIIEASRKAETDNPRMFVNFLIKTGQNRIRWSLRDTIRHNGIVSPVLEEDGLETACDIEGSPMENIFEQIKLFSTKKETDNGEKDV